MAKISFKDAGLAGLSGLMLTASFSPIDLDWIAWAALIPLLMSIEHKSSSTALRLGLFSGLCHYLTLVYWIVVVLSHYGNINLILSLAALFLLSLYLALYIAFFAFIVTNLRENRLPSFWGASVWVALEYARAHMMTGFPWCLLGYSQYSRLPLIQVANMAGVYGLSFVIVLVNLVLYRILFISDPRSKKPKVIETILTSFLIGFILVYGHYDLKGKAGTNSKGKGLRAVIVQGNIDQSLKWNPDFQEKTLAIYKELSETSAAFKPEIIIWPETAVPLFFQDSSSLSNEVFNAARITHSNILFGSPAYVEDKDAIHYYNRAYMISENHVLDYYDKVHLVPLGEYVPLKKYLPFVHRIVPAAGDFSPGKKVRVISGPDFQIGVLICFEAIFADISRKFAAQGAKLLVNITNDAWFGRTSAPHQHLSMAVFRCVENGLPMARAANTGISAFILPDGRIIERSGLFVRDVLQQEIGLRQGRTFYSQFGDTFAIIVIVATIIRSFWFLTIKRGIGLCTRQTRQKK